MTGVQIDPSWQLLIAVVILVTGGIFAAYWGRIPVGKQLVIAAVRAALQLAVVASIVVFAISRLWASGLFVLIMFVIAVVTTTGRVETRNVWWWSSLAIAAGVVPVLAVIYLTGLAPLNGYSLIPIGSIIVGNMMTAHTLAGRRYFSALREDTGSYEAALALGFERPQAIWLVLAPVIAEPLIPILDTTRTVGLVTLPGAFIGVLLGGGSPLQAGAAQLLVQVGIMVGQTITAAVMKHLITTARLLPADLKTGLHP